MIPKGARGIKNYGTMALWDFGAFVEDKDVFVHYQKEIIEL